MSLLYRVCGEWLCCSPISIEKEGIKIETLKFEDYEELACYASDKFDEIKEMDGDVAIIAKYDNAKEILKELLCLGHNVISLDIHEPDWEDYAYEYSITICDSGVWCEKAKHGNEYFYEVADVVFVLDDCSSNMLKKIETKFVYEVSVGEDEDSCDGDCENCELHGLESDNQSDSDVKITVNGKPATASEALEVVKELESRMEHINDIYIEMDTFRKLFNW